MMQGTISAADPFRRDRLAVLDTEMAYVDTGAGDPVVFLHGNPTSSYLWRNVIPHVAPFARCLAPDLVGMGDSEQAPAGSYRFADHAHYLDAWFERMGLNRNVTLVCHDWGSALAFDWAYRNRERVKGIVYMEAITGVLTWEVWTPDLRRVFQQIRSPAGEELVLKDNIFVDHLLPLAVLRGLGAEEMAVYRRPFLEPGESRRPTLTWPRELPIDGEPADVTVRVERYAEWLSQSGIPKLFINAEPGLLLTGARRESCRAWPSQREVTVPGIHYIQEDSPDEIGVAIAEWYRAL